MARWRKPSDRYRVRRQIDLKLFAHCPKNSRQVVHIGLPVGESIRCRLLLGLAVSAASCSNPSVALTRSEGVPNFV